MNEETERTCAAYCRAIESGTEAGVIVGELAAVYGVQRPAIWRRLRSGGVLPAYAPRVAGGSGRPKGGGIPGFSAKRRLASLNASGFFAEAPAPVDRDPCSYCGVRADLGCKHNYRLPA